MIKMGLHLGRRLSMRSGKKGACAEGERASRDRTGRTGI